MHGGFMSITAIAISYNEFQHAFGQGNTVNYTDLIQDLFAPAFKKVANGNLLVSESSLLLSQLHGVKEAAPVCA